MNKRSNPFYSKSQSGYGSQPPSQPPLPPGQPPAQPAYDYSAYWAAAAQAAQQQFGQSAATPATYANYGYGPAWQQQQSQQQSRQTAPPPPPSQPPPAPVPQYQYPPSAPAPPPPQAPPPPAPVGYAAPAPAPPAHSYSQYPAQPSGQPPPPTSARPPPPGRNPPQQGYNSGPPAKRGRFDGPPRGGRPSGGPPQFRGPNQNYSGPPAPSPTAQPGVNQTPLGQPPDNGGAYSRGGSRGMGRGRGQPLRGARGRGSAMLGGRPPMSGSSRGGSGRGNASLRGGRGGGFSSSSRSDRVPFQAPQSHNGWGRGPVGAPAAPASVAGGPQEGKRTLTDFRIIGFGFTIPEENIVWSWGGARVIDGKDTFGPVDIAMKSDSGKDDGHDDTGDSKPKKSGKETARIRIYFQPSVITAGSSSRTNAMGPPPVVPPRQSVKRKKSDSDDESERTNAKRHHPDRPRSASLDGTVAAPNDTKTDAQPVVKSEDVSTTHSETPTAEEQGTSAPSVTQSSEGSNDWLVEAFEQADEEEEGDDDNEHYEEHEAYEHEREGDEEVDSLFGSARASPPNGNGPELIINTVDEPTTEDKEGESASGPQEKKENGASAVNRIKRPRDDDSVGVSQTATSGQSGASAAKGNKLSISYASSSRRLVFEADVIEYFKVYRSEGRIDFMARIGSAAEGTGLQGISLDVLNEATQQFQTVTMPSTALPNVSDNTLPLLSVTTPRKVVFHVFLDLENPLSVPRWVKTGDVDDWLQSMFGPSNRGLRAKDRGWEGKISVVDPDPAPTIQTIFENWATNSLAAQQKDREQFLRQVMGEDKNKDYDMDGVMEILLRMVRGRDQHHQDGGGFQASHHHHNFNVSNALFQAASPGPAIAQHQTPASLAVLALFRALQDFGVRLSGEEGKREANERAKSVLRMMPQNALFRSLDGMFREWYSEKRGHR